MSTTPRITLLGAETGKIKAISEPLAVYRVADLEGEQIAARFVLVPPRMERICARSRHGTSGRHLEREERRTTLRRKATPHAVVCSAARRWTLQKPGVPFPSVLSADGLTSSQTTICSCWSVMPTCACTVRRLTCCGSIT